MTNELPGNSADSDSGSVGDPGSGINPPVPIQPSNSNVPLPVSASLEAVQKSYMVMITGISALLLSNTLAIIAFVWHCYNTTHGLPTGGLLADWALGLILTPYGGSVVLWIKNEAKKRS